MAGSSEDGFREAQATCARGRHQGVRRLHGGRRPRPGRPAGVVLRPARPLGLRQDDDPADGGRARAAQRGRVLIGDTDLTGHRPYERPVNTVFQSYALFPHLTILDNVAFGPKRRGKSDAAKLADDALDAGADRPPRRPQADPALRWPAAARGPGPGAGQPARGAAARRAARRARPQAASPDAGRAQADPDRGGADLHPRHARPGGGHDDGRHRRRDEPGADRADGRPGSLYDLPRDRVRRQLPRPVQPRHRPQVGRARRRPRRGRGARARRSGSRWRAPPSTTARSPSACGPRRSASCAAGATASATTSRASCIDVSFTGVATQYLVSSRAARCGAATSRTSTSSRSTCAPATTSGIAWDPTTPSAAGDEAEARRGRRGGLSERPHALSAGAGEATPPPHPRPTARP